MEQQVNLSDYLIIAIRKWWVIAAVVAVVLVVAVLYALRLPDVYEARTKLLIVNPVSERVLAPNEEGAVLTRLAPQLSVGTLNALATANDLLQKIIETLDLRDESGRQWAPEQLAGLLEPGVETAGTSTQAAELPLLTMRVRGDDPALLKRVAETWANLFVDQNAQLFATESGRSFAFIESQYAEAATTLSQLQEQQEQHAAENPLPLWQDELGIKRADLKSYLETLLDTSVRLELERESYQEALKRFEDLTVDGVWIGFQEADPGDMTADTATAEQMDVLQAKERVFSLEERLKKMNEDNQLTMLELGHGNDRTVLNFQEDNEISLLKQQLLLQTDLLRDYMRQIVATQNNLEVETKTLEALEEEIKGQPQFFVIVKAIDDPALWQQLGLDPTSAEWERVREIGLRTEITNPVYSDLNAQITNTRVAIETDRETLRLLGEKLKETEAEVKRLNRFLGDLETLQLTSLKDTLAFETSTTQSTLDLEFSRLQAQLSPAQTRYSRELSNFVALTEEVINRRNSLQTLEVQEQQYQRLVDSYEADWRALSGQISLSSLQTQDFDREIATLQASLDELARFREQARIAKAESEGSIRQVESAVEPQFPVGPNRRQVVAVAGAAGLVLGVIGAFAVNYVQVTVSPGGGLWPTRDQSREP